MARSRRDRFFSPSLLTIILLCSSTPLLGQYRVASSLIERDASVKSSFHLIPQDSLQSLSSAADTLERRGKSPGTAVLLSAILPGAGQIYTKGYWKTPIIWGFSAYFISQWIKANDLYLSARSKYRGSVERGENGGQGSAQLLYERDFYRDERDRFAFYFALTYLLNVIDAYVGASLYNFEVTDNLGSGAGVRLSIPLR